MRRQKGILRENAMQMPFSPERQMALDDHDVGLLQFCRNISLGEGLVIQDELSTAKCSHVSVQVVCVHVCRGCAVGWGWLRRSVGVGRRF